MPSIAKESLPRKTSQCRRCFLVALSPARSVARRCSSRRRPRSPAAASITPRTIRFRPGTTTRAIPSSFRRRRPPSTSIRPAARSTSSRSTTSAPSPNATASSATGGSPFSLRPASAAATASAIDQIRRALAGAGLRGYVSVGSYPDADPSRASPVRLVFQGLKATVAGQCGLWPTDLASGGTTDGWKNEPYPNFGCATQATLAAQVADPRDLVQSRASGPGDVAMRLGRSATCATAQIPAPTGRPGLPPIGQVGGN